MNHDQMGHQGRHSEGGDKSAMHDAMAHDMALPENTITGIGAEGPHDLITMGGMFTVFKVRDTLSHDQHGRVKDSGWYQSEAGKQARLATAEELARDRVKL